MFDSCEIYNYDEENLKFSFEILDPCLEGEYFIIDSTEGIPYDGTYSILWSGLFLVWLIDFYREKNRCVSANIAAYFKYIKVRFGKTPNASSIKLILQSFDKLYDSGYYYLYYFQIIERLKKAECLIE